ncbi:putative nuclease HARBI1 [Teleopsis dalmanni]|uniref:putative nuclease HARBI1 n=1 Tax=Teleopsis dalmanni TaxID=139649 RepID=UPI0018CF4137|nr:putative nuclease HARBI1 [Teleopsis dalmanni]XP_037940492.1 putative nuclease HARBI1 [Teleopsis dalmanni]
MNNSLNVVALSMLTDRSSDLRRLQDEKEINEILDVIFASSSSSSSEESDFEQDIEKNSFEITIADMSDEEFKRQFKIERKTAEKIISRFSQSKFLPNQINGGRNRIGDRKSVFMYVWYVISTVSYRELSGLFGVSASVAWCTVRSVTEFLISISHEFVNWPRGKAALESMEKFQNIQNIPGVIGAIDVIYIPIRAPKLHKGDYLNHKNKYSIALQAVVDADKKFIDITCGEPGCLRGQGVLEKSNLDKRAKEHYDELFPNSSFVIGDSAYSSTNWLVPPFKNNELLSVSHKKFNEKHSQTRIVVENAFELLKTRFQRLSKFTEQTNLPVITNIVASTCVLHNICLSMNDFWEPTEVNCSKENDESDEDCEEEQEEFEEQENELKNSINRRDQLFKYLKKEKII